MIFVSDKNESKKYNSLTTALEDNIIDINDFIIYYQKDGVQYFKRFVNNKKCPDA